MTSGGKMYHREYGGAGLVTGKDTPDLLEAAIMPWLTEDLQAINNQRVILETSDDNLLRCYFVESDEDTRVSSHIRVIERVKIYNTGDLKWMAMLLGMDACHQSGVSSVSCAGRNGKPWIMRRVIQERLRRSWSLRITQN